MMEDPYAEEFRKLLVDIRDLKRTRRESRSVVEKHMANFILMARFDQLTLLIHKVLNDQKPHSSKGDA